MKNITKVFEVLTSFDCLFASVCWEKFSLTSYQMLTSLSKQGIHPGTIVDVGANVGQFTIASANIYPEAVIYSFEPLPNCYSKLKQNARKYKRVTASQTALGEAKGKVVFQVNEHSHSSSILPLSKAHKDSFPEAKVSHEIEVEVSTLDDEIDGLDLKHPILLKIDVQGYETQVLNGGQKVLKNIDYVILESSFRQMYEGELLFLDIIDRMQAFGFEFLRPVGWLTAEDTGEIVQMDMLFTRNVS